MLSRAVTIGHRVKHSHCQFGDYVSIADDNVLEWVEIGDYSYTGSNCYIQHAIIDAFVNIAPHVRIGATNHPIDAPALHHFIYRKSLFGLGDDDAAFFQKRRSQICHLKADCWLGHGAIVLPGITIGIGAIVGAGSVVTKDVPDFAIVAGNPAKLLRYRFCEADQAALKRIAWWDWSRTEIEERVDDFWLPLAEFIARYDVSIRD